MSGKKNRVNIFRRAVHQHLTFTYDQSSDWTVGILKHTGWSRRWNCQKYV